MQSTTTMPNSNALELSGFLTSDPTFDAGSRRLVFRIGNRRNYKDAAGQWHQASSFFNVIMWGADAVSTADLLHKGDGVVLKGRLTSNSWSGKDGKRRYDVEVVAYKLDHYPKKTARVGLDDSDVAIGDAGQDIAKLAMESPLVCALMNRAITAAQFEELTTLCITDAQVFSWDAATKELVDANGKVIERDIDFSETEASA